VNTSKLYPKREITLLAFVPHGGALSVLPRVIEIHVHDPLRWVVILFYMEMNFLVEFMFAIFLRLAIPFQALVCERASVFSFVFSLRI
jgi:hypothetical protein